MLHYSFIEYIYLFLSGIVASTIDSIAGSGGIITVPVLLSIGAPPIVALGTNKLQEPIGQFIATWRFIKTGELRWKLIIYICGFSIAGVSAGVLSVQLIHSGYLQRLLPILLMLALIYIVFSRKLFVYQTKPKMPFILFSIIFGSSIGFYNGFFGPGTGLLWTTSFIYFLSMNLRLATMYAKPANLCCNIIALVWFIIAGHVLYKAAFVLGLGGIVGSLIGAKVVIEKGTRLIKPVFIVMMLLLTTNLLLKAF